MSINIKGKAPATKLATAAIAVVTLFGAISCSANGSDIAQDPIASTPKSPEDDSTVVRIIIKPYTDAEGKEFGDKAFEITKDGTETTGDIFCTEMGLQATLKKLKGQVVEDLPNVSSATIILKNDPACKNNFLTNSEAYDVVEDLAEGL